MKKILFYLVVFTMIVTFQLGCSAVTETMKNAERLKFKLGSVDNFNLAGVKLKNVSSLRDFSILDGAALVAAFTTGKMPARFNVNLIAKNPDSPGGSTATNSLIKQLDWRLLIDNKDIIDGSVSNISVPGVGQQVTIPIPISIDLLKFFGDGGYESLINLALALGGKTGNSSRVTLKIKPTIDTFLGGITYPGEINVIDKEFR